MTSELSKDIKFSEEEVTSRPCILEGEEQTVASMLQSSIFALTLDDLQYSMCEVGCNFGSMNIDEFMRNIRNVEEFQAATGGGLVGMDEAPVVGAGGSGGGEDAGGIGLCWQWSFSLPLSLCWKMVDEQRPKINRDPQPVHAQP